MCCELELVVKRKGECSSCRKHEMVVLFDHIYDGDFRFTMPLWQCVDCLSQIIISSDGKAAIVSEFNELNEGDSRPSDGKYLTGLGTHEYRIGPECDGPVYSCKTAELVA